MNKKYIIRRNLAGYSEEIFAKKLMKLKQQAFFPFKDTGVDIISIDKKYNSYFYQLKARNIGVRIPEFWFMVVKNKLNKFPNTNKSFWVFCCFKEDSTFDFFVVPLKIVKKWFNLYNNKCKKKKDRYHLSIKPLSNNKYEITPKWLNNHINIMNYKL